MPHGAHCCRETGVGGYNLCARACLKTLAVPLSGSGPQAWHFSFSRIAAPYGLASLLWRSTSRSALTRSPSVKPQADKLTRFVISTPDSGGPFPKRVTTWQLVGGQAGTCDNYLDGGLAAQTASGALAAPAGRRRKRGGRRRAARLDNSNRRTNGHRATRGIRRTVCGDAGGCGLNSSVTGKTSNGLDGVQGRHAA